MARPSADTPAKSGNFLCHGGHERCKTTSDAYGYPQFALRHINDFAGYSDRLNPGPPLEHYQTFLSELESFRADSNAVAFWSDAAARTNDARVWGGFVSARSGLQYGQDAQLVGLEIDVLNGGLPGVFPNRSKVGLQVVGFGKPNSNAIEILTEAADSGQFMNAISVQPHTLSIDGTVLGVGPQDAAIGLNFEGSTFRDAAILLSQNAPITFRTADLKDARVYREASDAGHLVLDTGSSGLKIVSTEASAPLLTLSPDGWLASDSIVVRNYMPWAVGFAVLLVSSLTMNVVALVCLSRVRSALAASRVSRPPSSK